MGTIAKLEVDQAIAECLHNWQLQRLAAVDGISCACALMTSFLS